MNLTKEQVQLMLKRHLQQLIKEYDKPAVPNWQVSEVDQHQYATDEAAVIATIGDLEGFKAEYNAKIHSGNYEEVEPIAKQLLKEKGLTKSDIDKSLYDYLCSGLLRVKIKGFNHYQERLSGNFTDELEDVLEDKPEPVQSPPSKQQIETITLGELADAYAKEKSDSWSVSSKNDWQTIRKTYFRFADPAIQVHTITRKVFYEYRDLLKCLLSKIYQHPKIQ